MSVNDWRIAYRMYSSQELDEERARLKEEAKNALLSQSAGSRSYTRSVTQINQQLRALAEVVDENNGVSNMASTYVDFSQ